MIHFDARDEEQVSDDVKRKKLCMIELPANLNITQQQANHLPNIRRYCAEFENRTLPDAIEVEAAANADGWRIIVWENPNTERQ